MKIKTRFILATMALVMLFSGCTKDIEEYIDFLDKRLVYFEWVNYLLEHIFIRYGYDFRRYQRDMLDRRLKVFMIKHDIKHIKDCVGVILFNKSAFKGFFLELSINVTEFVRSSTTIFPIFVFNSFNTWLMICASAY